MPSANQSAIGSNGRIQTTVAKMLLPTKALPHYKDLMSNVYYKCTECTQKSRSGPVYHNLISSLCRPMSSPAIPGYDMFSAKGIVATRFLVMCAETGFVPKEDPQFDFGICDMERFPEGYQSMQKGGSDGGNLHFDDEEVEAAAASKKPLKFGSRQLKTSSDLKTKPAVFAPTAKLQPLTPKRKLNKEEKKMIQEALDHPETLGGLGS